VQNSNQEKQNQPNHPAETGSVSQAYVDVNTLDNTPSSDLSKQNPREIARQQLKYLFKPDDVFEICAIGPKWQKHASWSGFAGGKKAIVAGWFDDIEKVLDVVAAVTETDPTAIYCTLNPVNPALMARGNNRLQAGIARTQDKEIKEIRHLLIDADPVRPAGISSTDQEKEAALELLRIVYSVLKILGWAEPLIGDSGNGGHLIYKLEGDCAGMVPGFLKVLDHKYSTDTVNIDTTVGNPARLVKLYGTYTRKGDSTIDRPHRRATILSLPKEVK